MLLATFVALAPLCLVLGFFYALACSIVSRLEESAASAATRVYLGEAIGTFLGGILLTYVLLQAMDAFQIALVLAAVDCLAGFAVWRHSSRAAEKRGWALLACCVLFSATAFSALSRPAEPYASFGAVMDVLSLAPRYEGRVLLHSADTIYGRVDVAENQGQKEFYQNGSLVGTTHMDRSAEEAAFLAALAHPAPGQMLIIGGAVNGVLSKALELPWMRVDDVELDPELVASAREFGDEEQKAALSPGDLVRILTDADGRLVVKRYVAALRRDPFRRAQPDHRPDQPVLHARVLPGSAPRPEEGRRPRAQPRGNSPVLHERSAARPGRGHSGHASVGLRQVRRGVPVGQRHLFPGIEVPGFPGHGRLARADAGVGNASGLADRGRPGRDHEPGARPAIPGEPEGRRDQYGHAARGVLPGTAAVGRCV